MTNEDSYFLFDRPGPFLSLKAKGSERKEYPEDETVVDAIAYLDQKEQHWDD